MYIEGTAVNKLCASQVLSDEFDLVIKYVCKRLLGRRKSSADVAPVEPEVQVYEKRKPFCFSFLWSRCVCTAPLLTAPRPEDRTLDVQCLLGSWEERPRPRLSPGLLGHSKLLGRKGRRCVSRAEKAQATGPVNDHLLAGTLFSTLMESLLPNLESASRLPSEWWS